MVHVIARIVGAGVVAHPSLAVIDVRSIGMTGLIRIVAMRIGRLRCAMKGRGPALGRLRMVAAQMLRVLMLRDRRHREGEQSCECNVKEFHRYLLMTERRCRP
jgi:hypothetical protein